MIQKFEAVWWKLVRLGFRLLYNELAWTYDVVSWLVSFGQWQAWQASTLQHIPSNSVVLELAHGTGSLQQEFLTKGINTVGIDISPYMSRIATNKLKRGKFSPRLVQASAFALPFQAHKFHALISTFPTNFIIQTQTLREAYRVLDESGKLIIVVGSRITGKGLLARFIEWLYHITGQRENWGGQVSTLFAQHGFSASVVIDDLPQSEVMLIIATKLEQQEA